MKRNENFGQRLISSGWCIWCLAALASGAGCVGPRPLRGGHALTTGPVAQSVVQGENASAPSRQEQETVRVRTYTVPAGSVIVADRALGGEGETSNAILLRQKHYGGREHQTSNLREGSSYELAASMPVTEREETRARTELGPAQKDTARDLAAKLSSLKGIVWVGVGLFIFGIASLVYPPLQTIIGSVTTSIAIILGGIALMVLPTLIVGNELLILGAVAAAVGIWFLAHRHGTLKGQLLALLPAKPAATAAKPTSVP